MDEIKPSGNGEEGNPNRQPDEPEPDEQSIPGPHPVDPEPVVPAIHPVRPDLPARADAEQTGIHKQERNKNLTPEPRDPNSGRMTILTAIIAIATIINIGVFWYESEDTSGKIKTLSDKAGEIVGTMNTALSNNQTAISEAFDANRKAVEASERQSKTALDSSINAFRLDQRPWVGIDDFRAVDKWQWEPTNREFKASFSLTLKNTGKTPAINVFLYAIMVPNLFRTDVTKEQSKMCFKAYPGYSLFPGKEIPQPVGTSVRESDFDELRFYAAPDGRRLDGGPRMNDYVLPGLIGCVVYNSGLSTEVYSTGFAYELWYTPDMGRTRRQIDRVDKSDIPAGSLMLILQPLGSGGNWAK